MRSTIRRFALSAVLINSLFFIDGCATPRHTNTLIFATNTKVAIDVSQDPTGALGVTLGYKRQEGVWMPLLANKAADSSGKNLIPDACAGDACKSFIGSSGGAGNEDKDTYSVLATFGGSTGGDAKDGKANASVAQYFATGLAARLLAQNGGAAMVNTGAEPAVQTVKTVTVTESVQALLNKSKSDIDAILAETVANDGTSIDTAKMSSLADKTKLDDTIKNFLKAIKTKKITANLS